MEDIKYFGKWSVDDLEVKDLGLQRYINTVPMIIPHSHGRHEHKRFRKSNVNILERFINRLMVPGLSKRKNGGRKTGIISGKKVKTIKIVENVLELISLRTNKNPIQILIDAVIAAAPREETTRISYGGIVYQQAVDIAPQRRVDLALKFLVEGSFRASFNNPLTIEEIIAQELITASQNDSKSNAVRRKEEKERLAQSAR
ncbi:MAG: 30S ribosomal protein S7 [Candidatus Lokiarchaeota archaeon]|nr:30S ribosomal protein S7 [Candidatus Lokiarchaeota archaeon]